MLALFVLGALVLVVRGPLPVDETRYLEVARELSLRSPLTLHLNGAPYVHKPPLAFWVAKLLAWAGVPLAIGMRLLPAVATAGSAWFVGRLGRRVGVRHAAWLYACMLLPSMYTQVLLIDPLLTLALWWSLFEWSRGRDGLATCAAGLAFLTKGPIAALYLLPLGCALAGLREERSRRGFSRVAGLVLLAAAAGVGPALAQLHARWGERTNVLLVVWWSCWAVALLALLWLLARRGRSWGATLVLVTLGGALAMAAWALASALGGGEALAMELLVRQTGGRITDSFAHSQPALFYVPILLVGALPAAPLFFLARPHGVARRLTWAAAASVAALMAIDGKQPHYVLPLFPALALVFAQVLEEREGALQVTRRVALGFLATLCAVWVVGLPLARGPMVARFGPYAVELVGSPLWWSLWALGGLSCAGAVVALQRGRGGLPGVSMAFLAGLAAIAWPAHYALGKLTTPRRLQAALEAEPQRALAFYQCFQGGYFNRISGRAGVARIEDDEDLRSWCARHPDGWILQAVESISDADDPTAIERPALRVDVVDYYRGHPYVLRRLAEPEPSSERQQERVSSLTR